MSIVGKVGGTHRSAIVQYRREEHLVRVVLPLAAIASDGTASLDDLDAGVPASADWSAHFRGSTGPLAVEQALQHIGVWTVEDLKAKWAAAQKALTRLLMADMVDMLRRAEAQKQED